MIIKSIALEADDLKISGQLYLPEGGQAPYPAVCICHGIPTEKPDPGNKGYPPFAERICHQGFAVLIFNFRGTGTSGGNFDILGWTRDLKAAINYLSTQPEVDKSRLSLLGFSGGAAVSIYVASQESRVSCVAVCACPAEFTFITEVDNPQSVIDHFRRIGTIRDKGFPHSTEEWLNGFRLVSPVRYVAGIAPRPLLLVHGNQDDMVPVTDAYKLYEKASEPKQIIIVDGAGHRLRQDERAMAIVIDWLKSRRV
jgi:alpha/beta superfamily hydrolase